MFTLNLTEEERQALMDVVECSVVELHSEIQHTDRKEYKDCLKGRKQLLLNLMERMKQATPARNP